jgi:hypothetical protein
MYWTVESAHLCVPPSHRIRPDLRLGAVRVMRSNPSKLWCIATSMCILYKISGRGREGRNQLDANRRDCCTYLLYLRGLIAVVCAHRPYFSVHHLPNAPRASLIMVSTPLLDFDHQKGFEIPTKHKEAIRQLHWFGEVPKLQLQERYHLGNTIINRILEYKTPE